jgi:hypothetical protein
MGRVYNQGIFFYIAGVLLHKIRLTVFQRQRDYAPDYSKIPPHGRWQHFDVGGRPRVDQLLASWPTSTVDSQERARRLIDLFVVSVLLDAGAGTKWQYKSKVNGKSYSRSEGLAVASIEMFQAGLFSGNASEPHQVNAAGLKALTITTIGRALQVTPQNPIDGLEGRTGLLVRLGSALLANHEIFGDTSRPGNMLGWFLHVYSRNDLTITQTTCSLTRIHKLPEIPSSRSHHYGIR